MKTRIQAHVRNEFIFQVILVFIYLFAVVNDKHDPGISSVDLAYFVHYYIVILFIDYFLLPRYFYLKKYWQFWTGIVLVLTYVMLAEELVLEQWFYPDTRGKGFPGVIFTLQEILPAIVMLVGAKFGWDAFRKQTEVEQLKRLVTESELQFLKSQVNPHFLFNNLNNLYAYALEKSDKTPAIILKLSSLLRYMLYDCKEEQVPLEKEVKYLEDFIELQELQIEHRGKISFGLEGQTGGLFVAPLIMIVFVENCFKHSTSSQSSAIEINVQVKVVDQQLELICWNTFSEQNNTNDLSKGIGLENVKSRLQLLYPHAHELVIDKSNGRFTVHLTLELNNFAL